MYRNTRNAAVIALFICFAVEHASAQNSWINPAGGRYSDGTNWSDGVSPGNDDNAEFAVDGTYQVSWDSTVGDTINKDIDIDDGDISFQSIGGTFTHSVHDNLRLGGSRLTLGRDGGNPFRLQLGTEGGGIASLTMGGHPGGATMNVTHGSSVVALSGVFVIGSELDATDSDTTLNLESGGVLKSLSSVAVRGADTAARINISGAGSKLSADFMQVTSSRGESHISITNKGAADILDTLHFGSSRFGTPKPTTLTVSGDGSQLNVIDVGSVGDGSAEFFSGTVRVDSGANVTVDTNAYLAIGADRKANATISGPGTTLESGQRIYVGDSGGDGTLQVLDGAVVTSPAGHVATQSHQHPETRGRSKGTAVVDGASSRWDNIFGMFVGSENGDGKLTISNGGVVTAGKSILGFDSDADGKVIVNGNDSLFDVTNVLDVGRDGSASLSIENGGQVTVGDTTWIAKRGSVDLVNGVLDVADSIDNQGKITANETNTINGHLTMNGSESLFGVQSGQTDLIGNLTYNDGQIRIAEGSVLLIAGEAIGNGDYLGSGTVVFAQTLNPGNSAATVGFEGNVEIADATKTFIELGGTRSGEFDQLRIDGKLGINNGGLLVGLIEEFELQLGDKFLIADVEGALEGQFFGLGEGDLVDTFDGTDLFITYRGFGRNRGVGLFTVAIPEPSSSVLLATFCLILPRRKRIGSLVGRP